MINLENKMISESCYWKDELYKCYLVLARFINQTKYVESSFVKAEKAIMMSAYIIRKLDNAEKIPPDFLKRSITVSCYNKNDDRIVDHYSAIDFDKNYNFDIEEKETNNIHFFLDQIIHSFSYSITFSDDLKTPEGFLLNSDKTKNKKLYFISLEKYLTFILKISEGWIQSAHNRRDEKTKEMKLISASYQYPIGFNLNKIVGDTFKGIVYKRV